MPRFVILEHDWQAPHWDFMLEDGGVLKTWALAAEPGYATDIPAKESADHRVFYLDYEGEISGGRGYVKRWDGGTFDWLRRAEDMVEARLQGARLRGDAHLRRTAPEQWLLRVERA